jgi:hypothetical protein
MSIVLLTIWGFKKEEKETRPSLYLKLRYIIIYKMDLWIHHLNMIITLLYQAVEQRDIYRIGKALKQKCKLNMKNRIQKLLVKFIKLASKKKIIIMKL